ncbi:acyl-CoA thioesterase [Ectobacillus sp. sgz5001026]|uniref:acyl-CoA thioesterase n=1 Tax=Ectobacillus sp. sgz5001026 TaxID=3242473 RepID=UPI0036D29792
MKNISYIDDLTAWEKEFSFFIPRKVRFSDTDMFGHLNNKKTFTYFEDACLELFKQFGFTEEWMKKDAEKIIVVASMQCDYVHQVFYDEDLKVYIKIHKVGTSSIELHFMIKNEPGDITAVGRSTMVQVNKITGRGFPWSEEWKADLLQKEYAR